MRHMRPDLQQLGRALAVVADVLDARSASYCFDGRFAFPLDAGWKLVLSPDDAGRLRLEACLSDRVRATMWCVVHDHKRLAELAWTAKYEASALVA